MARGEAELNVRGENSGRLLISGYLKMKGLNKLFVAVGIGALVFGCGEGRIKFGEPLFPDWNAVSKPAKEAEDDYWKGMEEYHGTGRYSDGKTDVGYARVLFASAAKAGHVEAMTMLRRI